MHKPLRLQESGVGNDFLDMTPNAQVTKEKIGILDIVKIKYFGASKDTIKIVKRQPSEEENEFHTKTCA